MYEQSIVYMFSYCIFGEDRILYYQSRSFQIAKEQIITRGLDKLKGIKLETRYFIFFF